MQTRVALLSAIAALVSLKAPAGAFQIESIATTRCHERITTAALADSGWPDGASPPAASDLDELIIDDVPFSLDPAVRDRWGVSLLIGVRDPDVGGNDPADLAALSSLHDDPALQPEHCLRLEHHDGDGGNAEALAACRAHILAEIESALGPGDEIDLGAAVTVDTYLKFRGDIELSLGRFAFHMGRALHALQDSYTHSFRDPDDLSVRTVLNWVEGNLASDHSEPRDGHRHENVLDDCSRGTAAASRREAAAIEASAALLAAVADPAGERAGRLERAAAVLDARLELEPGCDADNDYCGAPELAEIGGCSTTAAPRAGGMALVALIALVAGLGRRRSISVALCAAALIGQAGIAAAEDRTADAADEHNQVEDAELDRQDRVIDDLPDPTREVWGAALSGGAAFDRGAAAVSAGVRFNPFSRVGFGLDVELNPWISYNELDVAPGVVSVYVPATIRLKSFGTWELRTTVSAGVSALNFDLVGAERGSVGLFVGWNPLGVAIPMGADFKLIVKPGDIAVPIPQLSGIPFYYHQYRTTVSLEWYPD